MSGGFKTVNLVWVNKFSVIGYVLIFFHESAHSYEGGLHVPQDMKTPSSRRSSDNRGVLLLPFASSATHVDWLPALTTADGVVGVYASYVSAGVEVVVFDYR